MVWSKGEWAPGIYSMLQMAAQACIGQMVSSRGGRQARCRLCFWAASSGRHGLDCPAAYCSPLPPLLGRYFVLIPADESVSLTLAGERMCIDPYSEGMLLSEAEVGPPLA